MFGLAINLLGIRKAIGRAFAWATQSAAHIFAIGMVFALVWGYVEHRSAAKWKRVAESTFAAQKAASEAQTAVNNVPAEKSAAIARKSNEEAPAYYAAAHRAAAANAVRLRPQSCPASPPDMPRADPPVEGVHGPALAAPLVCRPFVEDNQIVGAAARAAEMRQEALDLIAEGVAEAGE